uniref:peptidylprolyl isomerase n=1 Tax=Eucampia antarctica TaxID=49252 RepID=A0A7S2RC24_9STRA|mmetsp:Transcript_20142/g.19387  ORF Transcript_20142/g.19387 Transcript_20142/m.19387 type:complete len:237 (+) Transcript_20142:128-838(+)|eukprot:CAMPEP_0197833586 /NCGR_PEP_ID=MMETSP1437-20131217/19460_1 /TAXON_ID=49252 ORGANISM="Eucampia antarctica, Strain CCMP1452" /NCGR_SAMPLE_ID=MMETSP1437 /ASSEMBLY_ACC=CAM_ASM_001096 /LENGTH=236 /DNA_ID=CAMNT_0043437713 /DNA_START=128 /DNA_END=838 /DNA_ORIENTATION=+
MMKGVVMKTWMMLVVLFLTTTVVEGGSNELSIQWLKENAEKEGVISVPSGLQYKILKKGSGRFHPALDTSCSCHYAGTLIDGTEFDSSYDRGRPTSFAPNQVIKGWTEAMQMMVAGDKWELYIPSDLAYGDNGSPPKIGGGDALIFQMEIVEVMSDEGNLAWRCDLVTFEDCTEKEIAYIGKSRIKYSKGDPDEIDEELERLARMSSSKSKQSLKDWALVRTLILKSLVQTSEDEL